MKYPVIVLLLVLCFSCNSKKPTEEPHPVTPAPKEVAASPAGDPCTYKDNVYPAKVVKIDGDNENSLDITFEITFDNKKKENLTYSSVYQRKMTMNEVEQNHILLDNTYKFIQSEIVSGTCNPTVKKFVFEQYKK